MKKGGGGVVGPLILNLGANVVFVVSFNPDRCTAWRKQLSSNRQRI
jgi:hypothetical protein